MSTPVPITIRFKYNSITVYVSIKPTETVVDLKRNLAEALNETKVLNRKIKIISTKKLLGEPGDQGEYDDEDEDDEEDIDIPIPSFATSSSSASKKDQNGEQTSDKKDENKDTEDDEAEHYLTILPENIKVGRPIRENDVSSGFTEIKSTANGRPQKLELAGISSNMTLAFTPTLEKDFTVNVMADDYYRDDD